MVNSSPTRWIGIKYMAIQEAMMSIKKTLESLIRNLEEEKNEWET